jgi:hypothetical protein
VILKPKRMMVVLLRRERKATVSASDDHYTAITQQDCDGDIRFQVAGGIQGRRGAGAYCNPAAVRLVHRSLG